MSQELPDVDDLAGEADESTEENAEVTTDDSEAEPTDSSSETDESEGESDESDESKGDESSDEEVSDESETEESTEEDELEAKTDEEKTDEDTLEGEDDPDSEILNRISFRQIRKEYPEFFKKFPQARRALAREQRFSSVFPNIAEAETAAEKSKVMDVLENTLGSGDAKPLFQSMAQAQALSRVASNLLPALASVDQQAYVKAVDPALRNMLRAAKKHAADSKNQNLERSIAHLSNYLFNSPDVPDDSPVQEDPRIKEYQQRETDRVAQEGQEFQVEVQSRIIRKVRSEIGKQFDPKQAIPEQHRKAFENDIFQELGRLMEKDRIHMSRMGGLWEKAAKSGMRRDMIPGLVSAYLERARNILPKLYPRYRGNGGKGTRKTRHVPEKGQVQAGAKKTGGKKVDWSKTSELDFLEDNVTYKE